MFVLVGSHSTLNELQTVVCVCSKMMLEGLKANLFRWGDLSFLRFAQNVVLQVFTHCALYWPPTTTPAKTAPVFDHSIAVKEIEKVALKNRSTLFGSPCGAENCLEFCWRCF